TPSTMFVPAAYTCDVSIVSWRSCSRSPDTDVILNVAYEAVSSKTRTSIPAAKPQAGSLGGQPGPTVRGTAPETASRGWPGVVWAGGVSGTYRIVMASVLNVPAGSAFLAPCRNGSTEATK